MNIIGKLIRKIYHNRETNERLRERDFLRNLNLSSKTVYDIGSSEGSLTLLFAEAVKPSGRVVAFEPNPDVFTRLKKRIEENNLSNVLTCNIGIGERNERKKLIVRLYDTGTGSMEKYIQKQIIGEGSYKEYEIEVYQLDNYLDYFNLPTPDFIKIDVEGMEYECLLGMEGIIKRYKPMLFVEIHGSDLNRKMRNVKKIVNFLDQRGYSLYHFESKRKISPETAVIAKEGHIFCR